MSDSALTTRTDPRISRRRKAVARGRRMRALGRVAIVAGVALALWLVFFSPLLAVREVKLSGAEHTGPADVQRVAGLDSSDNLLLLTASEVAGRVETLPWVLEAKVDRKLPGTVRVAIVERQPAMVVAVGEQHWLVDERGRVLAAADGQETLPVLAGLQLGDVEPGERLGPPQLRSALHAYSLMPAKLRRDVRAVFAPTVERITFQLADGIQVRYGAAEDMVSKNEVLAVLLERLRSEGTSASYIDVRVPEAPAVSSLSGASDETVGPATDDAATDDTP